MLLSLLLFLASFGALLLFGRLAHRGLHALSLLISDGSSLSTYLYALPLLPGVLLHELSHALAAAMLGVEVRSFSLIPKRKADSITLGTVEILRTDALKTSLIGVAPLITGMVILSAIGWLVFDTRKLSDAVLNGNVRLFINLVIAAFSVGDALLWFYILFAVANTMLPSAADRQSWPPVLLGLAVIFLVIASLFGAELLNAVGPSALRTLNWLSAVFSVTLFADVLVILPLWLLVRILERARNKTVKFK